MPVGGGQGGARGAKPGEGRTPSSSSLSGDSCLTPSVWDSCEMRQGSRSENANRRAGAAATEPRGLQPGDRMG